MKILLLFVCLFSYMKTTMAENISPIIISQAIAQTIVKEENFFDKFMISSSTAALMADWGTTLDLENHPERKETNQILGEYPSRGKSNTYFSVLTIAHLGANYGINKIQDKGIKNFLRAFENFLVIGIHGKAASVNFRAGMHMNF